MFVAFPLVTLVLLILLFQKSDHRWRSSAMAAALTWGMMLAGITEVLSIFHVLTFAGVLVPWLCASLVLCCVPLITGRQARPKPNHEAIRLSTTLVVALLGTALIVALVGLIAVVAPPNNWDSMTYHMSRVEHWIQNRTVAHYPAHELRQLYSNPGAEYIILHFQILSGGDRFANLVQWMSMVGCLFGTSLIAKELGASPRSQIFTAVICATIPIGILEASSTQNDYVASFWLVCLVYYVLRWKTRPDWLYSLGAGASLGLALLTKATAYLYAPPLLLGFGLCALPTIRGRLLAHAILVGAVALLLNCGHYIRNFELFRHPLNPGKEILGYDVANEELTTRRYISHVIRSIAMHTRTPSSHINYYMDKGTRMVHDFWGMDIDDPRTTFMGNKFDITDSGLSLHEDIAGDPIHLVLIITSIFLCLLSRNYRTSQTLMVYGASLTLAFLSLCMYLRWMEYDARYHLPLFVLWSPFVAVVLGGLLREKMLDWLAILLIVAASPWVFCNVSRPLIWNSSIFKAERMDLYCRNQRQLNKSFQEAAHFLRSGDHSQIGLVMTDWEYPIWALLRESGEPMPRLDNVNVQNVSSLKSDESLFNNFSPSAILTLTEEPWEEVRLGGEVYVKAWSSGKDAKPYFICVFTKRP